MRFAIPTTEGRLCSHFGHCEVFSIFDVDDASKTIKSVKHEIPPPHEPGVLPKWLGSLGVNVIIAGGMGMRAQELFAANNVKVVVGAASENPDEIVKSYLGGSLVTGDNICDH